jgi:hypothetical protein
MATKLDKTEAVNITIDPITIAKKENFNSGCSLNFLKLDVNNILKKLVVIRSKAKNCTAESPAIRETGKNKDSRNRTKIILIIMGFK